MPLVLGPSFPLLRAALVSAARSRLLLLGLHAGHVSWGMVVRRAVVGAPWAHTTDAHKKLTAPACQPTVALVTELQRAWGYVGCMCRWSQTEG